VLDGEAIVLRPDNSSMRGAAIPPWASRGDPRHVLAYDVMGIDGQDVRPERSGRAQEEANEAAIPQEQGDDDGIQLSEAITGDGVAIFRHACWMDFEGIVSKRIGSRYVSGRTRAWLETKNPAAAYCRFGHDPPWSGVLTCSAGHVVLDHSRRHGLRGS
jgi:bifunctional non-homologous end joining protein LigD